MKLGQLTTKQMRELTKLFCACPSVRDSASWNLIVASLEVPVEDHAPRSSVLRNDVYAVIRTCNSYSSVSALLEVVKEYDEGTVQWEDILTWLAKQAQAIDSAENGIKLPFKNRDSDKQAILDLLASTPRMQIQALRGWGKTYLLKELGRIFEQRGWVIIWFDLDGELDRELGHNPIAFLREIAVRLAPDDSAATDEMGEKDLLNWLGRRIANAGNVALLIDNIDSSDRTFSSWLGKTFAQAVDTWAPGTYIITTGQQVISEWKGAQIRRPFRSFSLQLINDIFVLKQIVDYVVEYHGFQIAKQRRTTNGWDSELEQISTDIVRLTGGHLLLIEKALGYAARMDGFVHPNYFSENSDELYQRCISPIINQRLLRDLDRDESQSFRQLCVFRYITPGILKRLIDARYPEVAEDYTTHIFPDWRSAMSGWTRFQKSGLLSGVEERSLYPLSPVVRRVISRVLKAENHELHQQRNRRAYHEYELLLQHSVHQSGSQAADSIDDKWRRTRQKIACVIEMCYHRALDQTYDQEMLQAELSAQFSYLLELLAESDILPLIAPELIIWLHADEDLHESITRRVGQGFYECLLKQVEGAVADSAQ